MTLTEISESTGVPLAKVVGINARLQYRMHKFLRVPFTDDCADCDGRKEESQHFTAKDQADRAIDAAREERE